MAQIDLKNARIYIRDGYSGAAGAQAGAVNNTGGYAAGVTTMTVDGFTAAVSNGDFFTVVGSPATGILTRHRITAHTETLSATTSITFTPALSAAVLDNAIITIQPHQIEIKVGEGNLTWSEKQDMQYVKDRGKLSTVRKGDEMPVELKMDFIYEFIKGMSGDAGVPYPDEAFKQIGNASGWTSAATDPCEPYAVDIVIDHIPNCSVQKAETVTFSDFRWEDISHDPKQGQVSVSGKCNIEQPTVVRSTT